MTTTFSGRVTPVMQRIIDALAKHGDMEADEIASTAHTSVNYLSGGGCIRHMLNLKLIRVSKWRRSYPGSPVPTYSVKPGKSIERPRGYTGAEKSRRWRQVAATQEYRQRRALAELVRISACS